MACYAGLVLLLFCFLRLAAGQDAGQDTRRVHPPPLPTLSLTLALTLSHTLSHSLTLTTMPGASPQLEEPRCAEEVIRVSFHNRT